MKNPARTTTDWSRRRGITLAAVSALSLTACGGGAADPGNAGAPSPSPLPQRDDQVELDPADFTVDITNQWWPMEVGDRWVFDETEGHTVQRVEVTVLDETRTIGNGVEARVVHDLVTEDGATVEDTLDFYAQDADGNVWYLGEETAEYENEQVVSTEGSWEAGVDGAQPGILLPSDPEPGDAYRQEYLADEAEDSGFVLSVDEQVQVPTGMYTGTLMTRDTTPLEPDLVELKFYAPGVGPVMEVAISGGTAREVLVESTRTG
jgi:hypothetical protein